MNTIILIILCCALFLTGAFVQYTHLIENDVNLLTYFFIGVVITVSIIWMASCPH